MTLPLYSRIILTHDVPEHALMAGDTGTIVDYHRATQDCPAGYEIECFAANGDTLAVITVFATDVREPTSDEITHVRPLLSDEDQPRTDSPADIGSDTKPSPVKTIGDMPRPQLTGRGLTYEEYVALVPDSLGGMLNGYLGSPDCSKERQSYITALLVNEGLQRVVNLFPREQWEEAVRHHLYQPLPGDNVP